MSTIRFWLACGAAAALPLFAAAQTTTAQTTTTKTSTVHTHTVKTETHESKTEEKHETKAEEKHETKAEEAAEHKAAEHKKPVHHAAGSKARVQEYSTRLAGLLADTQGKATLGPASWKAIANEANALANKLYAAASSNAKARKLAADARTHVREMHKAAMAGDAEGAKAHAGMALPFVYQLIDWSA